VDEDRLRLSVAIQRSLSIHFVPIKLRVENDSHCGILYLSFLLYVLHIERYSMPSVAAGGIILFAQILIEPFSGDEVGVLR